MTSVDRGIDALLFDAYGTLFDVYSVTSLCDDLFPGQGERLAQLWRAKQLQYSLLCSLMGRYRDFWHLTEDGLVYSTWHLGLVLTSGARKTLMDAYLSLDVFADVRPGLEQLRAGGVRLGILSNGAPAMLEAAAASAGIDSLLDVTLSADEVQVFKPSPRVYERGAERMGIASPRLGFVSANAWDVSGAASCGLRTFWIQRGRDTFEELGFQPDHHVASILELASLMAVDRSL